MEKQWKQWQILFSWAPKSLQMVTPAMKLKDTCSLEESVKVTQSCLTLCNPRGCSLPGSSVHEILQATILEWVAVPFSRGIFPTQGSNPCLLHCRRILHHLSHQGSPGILDWVAYPSSRASSWPRCRTGVSCTVGGFFTSWATKDLRRKTMTNLERVLKSRDIILPTKVYIVKAMVFQQSCMDVRVGP